MERLERHRRRLELIWFAFTGSFVICFLLGIHLLVLHHGMESIRRFEVWAGPLVYLVFGGMVWWAVDIAGARSDLFAAGKISDIQRINLAISCRCDGDYRHLGDAHFEHSRFYEVCSLPKEQIRGQFYGLPGTFVLFAFASITVTSGSQAAFGEPIWDVVDILAHFDNPYVIALSVITLCIAAISVNVAANIVSPAYDLANFCRNTSISSEAAI